MRLVYFSQASLFESTAQMLSDQAGHRRVAFLSRGSKYRKKTKGLSFYSEFAMPDTGYIGDKLGFSPSLFQPGLCSQVGGPVVCVKGRHLNEVLSKTAVSLGKAWFRAQGYLCTVYETMETELSALTVTESTGWIYPCLSALNKVQS